MKRFNLRDHTFYGPLPQKALVLDCGANHGDFSRLILDRFGVECHSFEPNPILRQTIAPRQGLTLHPEAVGGEDGEAVFMIDSQNSESSHLGYLDADTDQPDAERVVVPVAGLERLIAEFSKDGHRIALVKMDMEGAEYDALLATKHDVLRQVDQFSIEFHDRNNMMTVQQVQEVIAHLKSAGFIVTRWSVFGHGDVGAFHPDHVQVSRLQILKDMAVHRYFNGIRRRLSRMLGK